VREQAGLPLPDSPKPCPRAWFPALEPLVLPQRPAHQMAVDALGYRGHHGRVERGEVPEPSAHLRVDRGGEAVEGEVRVPVQPLIMDRAAELRHLFPGWRRQEAGESHLPGLVPCLPGTERVAQEDYLKVLS
jgi:hypothetical protein